MKSVTIIIVVWLCFGTIQAQQIIEKHIDFSGKESLTLNIQIADSINLHTWNKNEVFVTASVNINDNKDNEAYTTFFDESGNTVVVNAKFKDKYFKGKNNCCNTTDIYWQVYLPEKTDFKIETINGNITIAGQTEKMSVKSISGYIDLAVPVNRKADIDFSTISGTIYSNHELALNKMHTGIPTKIVEKLNNGGDPIKLETISGDIFFRKSN
jgi:predicted membrane protein